MSTKFAIARIITALVVFASAGILLSVMFGGDGITAHTINELLKPHWWISFVHSHQVIIGISILTGTAGVLGFNLVNANDKS